MQLDAFLTRLAKDPDSVRLEEALSAISESYDVSPVGYTLGGVRFDLPQSKRTCQLYAFGLLHGLPKDLTLQCFGDDYRRDVLQNPLGTDHHSIRLFAMHGFEGLNLDAMPLVRRAKMTGGSGA